jgi:hypothetical protein
MNENINLLNIIAGYIKIIFDLDVFNPSVNDPYKNLNLSKSNFPIFYFSILKQTIG